MYATFLFFPCKVRGLNTLTPQTEVTQIGRKLKPKERLFCSAYACTGDAELSAKRAGYRKNCRSIGERLLFDEEVISEIERQLAVRRRIQPRLASIGYQRLAFGEIDDALRLLFTEKPTPESLSGMDLFMISEIKQNRDGMLEIKFFDRLKALEKLAVKSDDVVGVAGLFDAIGRQAESGSDGGD